MYAVRVPIVTSVFVLCFLCFFGAGCAAPGNRQSEKVSVDTRADLLSTVARELAVPGAVYAELDVDGSGPVVYATGLADLEEGVPMSGDMSFRVGSVTKTFTATAILMLVDRGRLSLDDTVDTYLPGALPGGDAITVRQLLMMRSGLTDYHTSKGFADIMESDPQHVWTFEELAALVSVDDSPDEYFAYRNINYVTLGAILESLTGLTRAEFISREICAPLGLAHTFVPTSVSMPDHSAKGYVPGEAGPEDVGESVHPSWAGAAGDMISTAGDLAVWARALNRGTLLSDESHSRMMTMRGAYLHGGYAGYGLGILNLFGAVGHGGDYSGIYTSAVFEYQGRFIVALVNGQKQEDGGDATALFFRMAQTLYPPEDAPQWRDAQLQHTLDMARDCQNVPGIIAKIDYGNGTVWTGVTGLATGDDPSVPDTAEWTGEAMTDDLHFRIASVTKSVTATAILQLVDRGILSLDDTLARWLPDVDVSTKDEVTIRQLLNHTSGIPDFIRNPAFFDINYAAPLTEWTLDERIAYGVPLAAPGSSWSYSNTGYILLGLVIEAASGQSYGEYLEQHIFAPLGMDDSSVPGVTDFTVPAPHANGYTFSFNPLGEVPDDMPDGGWLKDQTVSNWQGMGYGNIIATPHDLLVWLRALTDDRLLSGASAAAMREYVDTDRPGVVYGLGVESREGYFGHDGDLPGYHAGAYGKDGHAIIVLINGDSIFGRGFEVTASLGGVLGL